MTLTSVAMLSGARSLYAIAQFGRDYGSDLAKAMGFEKGKTPCGTVPHYLFIGLDVDPFERAIGRWLGGRKKAPATRRGRH